jgi:hypothetical protein
LSIGIYVDDKQIINRASRDPDQMIGVAKPVIDFSLVVTRVLKSIVGGGGFV